MVVCAASECALRSPCARFRRFPANEIEAHTPRGDSGVGVGPGVRIARAALFGTRREPRRRSCALDLEPAFELSPYLYMQFMEPLGVTDSSVEAAWDHIGKPGVTMSSRPRASWNPRCCGGAESSPISIAGARASGPRDKRPTMVNLMWGGIESNQVGTAEFVDFARRVHAEPLMCVNFESDGRAQYAKCQGKISHRRRPGGGRVGRLLQRPRQRGAPRPRPRPSRCAIRYWQLGNETSYDNRGFDLDDDDRKTNEFARAMRDVDPTIQIIAWGDSGWAPGWPTKPASRSTCWPSITCSTPIRATSRCCEGELLSARPGRHLGSS